MDVVHTMSETARRDKSQVREITYSTREPHTIALESIPSENLQDVEKFRTSCRSSRPRIPNKKLIDFLLTENSEIMILKNSKPTTYRKVVTSPNSRNGLRP